MLELDLCVITARVERLGRGHLEVARAAVEGGASLIQLRDKEMSGRALWEVGMQMRRLTRDRGVSLVVNDRVDVAMAVGADGVHLGQDDVPVAAARELMGPDAIVGASVSNPEEAYAAEAAGASYVSFGPVFATASKADAGRPVGTGLLGAIKKAVSVPVLAIGGINRDNVREVMSAGADGVAVISAVAEAVDMMEVCAVLRRLIAEGRRAGRETRDDPA
jgi:thiamine-phosphate pyrophosphorylase